MPAARYADENVGSTSLGVELERGEPPWADLLRQVGALDQAAYDLVARTPTPEVDILLRKLSDAANHSRLWIGIAAVFALLAGRRGRHAALESLASVGVTSAIVNFFLKSMFRRPRPDRAGTELFVARHVKVPGSTSFPSGHAASAAAFAAAASRRFPAVAVPVWLLAATVAYSRVHAGVHYPGDTLVGMAIGAGTATTLAAGVNKLKRSKRRPPPSR